MRLDQRKKKNWHRVTFAETLTRARRENVFGWVLTNSVESADVCHRSQSVQEFGILLCFTFKSKLMYKKLMNVS